MIESLKRELNRLAEEAAELAERIPRAKDLAKTEGDKATLEQVKLNLISFAKEAKEIAEKLSVKEPPPLTVAQALAEADQMRAGLWKVGSLLGEDLGDRYPLRKITAESVATIADLEAAGSRFEWLWEGWIQKGTLTALASSRGGDTTAFIVDLLRRIRNGLRWPDGKEMRLPETAFTFWMTAADRLDKLADQTRNLQTSLETVRFHRLRGQGPHGIDLRTAETWSEFRKLAIGLRPSLLVIDTVEETGVNLNDHRAALRFYRPLHVFARETRCAVLCVTRLTAEGGFSGSRIVEQVRTVLVIGGAGQGDSRRRVEVVKSNSVKPPSLGFVTKDFGNEYDREPRHRS